MLLSLSGGAALAANNFNGAAVTNCTLDTPTKTYSCSSLDLPAFDTSTVIATGYTVALSSSVKFGFNQSLQMSGTARLQSSANIDIGDISTSLINISGGALVATAGDIKIGAQAQTITASITAKTVTIGSSASRITGTVSATGAITTGSNVTIVGTVSSTGGALNFGSDTTISGAVSGASITTNANVKLNSTLTVDGAINLGSGNTISGAVGGASITTNSDVKMGALTVTGAADLGSGNTVNGAIAAASIKTNSGVTVNGAVTVDGVADLGSGIKISGIVKANSVKTNSPGQIGGGIDAKTTISLGSGITVGGDVTGTTITTVSPVSITGNVKASVSLTLASGSTVNGNVSGGALTLLASGTTINGNVDMSGNVDMGSGSTINGDLKAQDVLTRSSDATINGNASVNSIYLDWGARVTKVITCRNAAPGSPVCNCVTRADSNYQPTCGAPTAAGVHHFRITHGGSALTCQPQTVTVTACANATCTMPHYNSNVTVKLQPGGKDFTVSGGVNNAATVQQSTEGIAVLSATSASAANPSTCGASGAGTTGAACEMEFKTSGLIVTAPNHVSMEPAVTVLVQAKTASNSSTGQTCVPLIASQAVNVAMQCGYINPGTGSAKVTLGSTDLACGSGSGGGSVNVPFTFNSNGEATVSLKYPDVGQVELSASYAGSGAQAGFNASGKGNFIAAPDKFMVTAARVGAPSGALPLSSTTDLTKVFAKASEAFTVNIIAVNAAGGTTKNFGKESTPEGVVIATYIADPDDTSKEKKGQGGTVTAGQFNSVSDGVFSSKSGSSGYWSFSDVGTINLAIKLKSAVAGATYYMGYATNPKFETKGSQNIGRFIPDHFDTVLVPANEFVNYPQIPHMDCALQGAIANPCPASGTGFAYSGQSFAFKVLAYNGASPSPEATINYAGVLAKTITVSAKTAVGGSTDAAGSLVTSGPFTFTKGVGVLVAPGATLPSFKFNTAYPADVLPATIYLRAIDSDGASSLRVTASQSVETPLTIVSGRLMISNANGSLKSPLPVNVSAQYYMPGGYVFNPQVNTVSNAIGAYLDFKNCQNALDTSNNKSHTCPGSTSLRAANANDVITLKNGKGMFRLAAPTPTLTGAGSTEVSLKPINNTHLIPYLPSSAGTATFGIYRSGPVIYTREVHN